VVDCPPRPWDRLAAAVARQLSVTPRNEPGSPAWSVNRCKCKEIGSYARAQELLRAGHSYLDRNGDGIACKSLRKG